ncbi:MAG: ATP-binding protein [Clostridiales bacterium]|nr:ATP-binding protein [Clostridiales bacterium]
MEYIERELERKFLAMNSVFKAVMVTGARQVGKSTMLKKLADSEKRTYVNLDNSRDRELAKSDPGLFFQLYNPPILIDEAQKAPELFEYIKIICDKSDKTGLFWLTGSESKKLLKEARDSLAGRICILKMFSLSQREIKGKIDLGEMDFSLKKLSERANNFPDNNLLDIYTHIWKGGMPGTVEMTDEQRMEYYESYIETYLIRDAVDDNGISDTEGFRKVLRACAAFAGNLVNYSDIAQAGNVSVPTAKEWVKILQSMGILFLVEPFSNNELKRLIKTPKLYFCDTGLLAYLSMWTSKETLMNGAASGRFFENYVVSEFLRMYSYSKSKVLITFYRDTNQKEIDIVIEENGILHPLEIKKSSNPEKKIINSFSLLEKSSLEVGEGGIICMIEKPFPLDSKNSLIPCNII